MIAQRNDCDSCPNQVANVTVNIDAALGTCSCFHRRNLFQTCVPRWDQSIGVAFEPLCDSCCRKNSSLYCIVVYGMVCLWGLEFGQQFEMDGWIYLIPTLNFCDLLVGIVYS